MSRKSDKLSQSFKALRKGFIAVAILSCAVNLLMLTGPVFMLQIYDRVLSSQSVPTLLVLSGIVVFLYFLMGLFNFFRTRVLSRISTWLDAAVAPDVYSNWLSQSQFPTHPGYKPLQDLNALRQFLSSPAILSLFDLPWMPLYLGFVFLLHFQLGVLASCGALVLLVLAIINEWLSSKQTKKAAQAELDETRFVEQAHANASSVLAMGMKSNISQTWSNLRNATLGQTQIGAERSEIISATSKTFRLLLQSAVLAFGAYLAIQQEISAGAIVAASIIVGRALAPMDQAIGGWRMIKRAMISRTRLKDFLSSRVADDRQVTKLPAPTGHLVVKELTKLPPLQGQALDTHAILSGVSFELDPGEGLGVIGPSASGKSTLAKLLVGLWMPERGSVRLDGATFDQWRSDDIGEYIGYLPQEVQLLPGTIGQNISRYAAQYDEEKTILAAKRAGVHELILSFAEGYETQIDAAISPLTGGQKQRIALARAIYGNPKLLVLDEPNSNLDAQGDQALEAAIKEMREAGCTVIVMAHRPSAIAAVDKILVLNEGRIQEFGPKANVLRKVTRVA